MIQNIVCLKLFDIICLILVCNLTLLQQDCSKLRLQSMELESVQLDDVHPKNT